VASVVPLLDYIIFEIYYGLALRGKYAVRDAVAQGDRGGLGRGRMGGHEEEGAEVGRGSPPCDELPRERPDSLQISCLRSGTPSSYRASLAVGRPSRARNDPGFRRWRSQAIVYGTNDK
jgi:hypothetical protein